MSSSKRQRSNSSQALRDSLKKNFVLIPELNSRIDLERYIKLALSAYSQAVNNAQNNNLPSAFIDFQKFYTLALDRIPLHPSYKTPGNNVKLIEFIKGLKKSLASSIDIMEDVVHKMDIEQDKVLHRELEHRLIDEFDGDLLDETPSPPVTANTGVLQSATADSAMIDPNCLKSTIIVDNYVSSEQAEHFTAVETSLHSVEESAPPLPSIINFTDNTLQNSTLVMPIIPSSLDILKPAAIESDNAVPSVVQTSFPPGPPISLRYLQSLLNQEELSICKYCVQSPHFFIPPPATSIMDLQFGDNAVMQCYRDDFHTSFTGFLTNLSPDLQLSNPVLEANRCFFIHLGIATSIHPFLFQSAFRIFAKEALLTKDCWYEDILSSVLATTGFVDANALSFLWPQELCDYQLLFISNPTQKPIFSYFASSKQATKEVVVLCQKEHFTLLRPCHIAPGQPFKVIESIMSLARAHGLIVQENEVQVDTNRSIERYFQSLK